MTAAEFFSIGPSKLGDRCLSPGQILCTWIRGAYPAGRRANDFAGDAGTAWIYAYDRIGPGWGAVASCFTQVTALADR